MKIHLISFLFAFLTTGMYAQFDHLPRQLSQDEKELLSSGKYSFPEVKNDGEPSENMRSMAEWEELQAVVITWTGFRDILAEIVRAAKEECEVLIICNDIPSVQNYLSGRGIDWSENVRFKVAPFNSIWIRDYGPNTVYSNDVEELGLVDWIYNRPRPQDDLIPSVVSEELGVPLFSTTNQPDDLVHTGGNFMSDGMGTGFSSELILDENGPSNTWGSSNHNEAAIDAIMQSFMGIDQYPKMTNLLYDAIHHIDMHMKLLDEETLLVGFYPDGVADGPQINANIEYILSQFKTPFGNDYKVHWIEMPPDFNGQYPDFNGDYRTYTNSLIVNKTVLVPTYEQRYDTTALRIWRELMPGYKIVGINCNAIIPLNGALHCITKEIGVSDPLLINMPKTVNACIDEEVTISALIKSNSDITNATFNYRLKGEENYKSTDMTGNGLEWEVTLDAFEEERTIEYYLSANNADGKSINRPLVAPEGYWSFDVKNCTTSSAKEANELISSIELFPNPGNAISCIKLFSETELDARISLTNTLGQEIMLIHSGKMQKGENNFFIPAYQMESGFYHIIIASPNGMISRKFLVN